MKLVNKPQFDKDSIKRGTPVRLRLDYKKFVRGASQVGKFEDGDYGLVLNVEALRIIILTVENKQVIIGVDDVADGSVKIVEMIEKEDK